MRKTFPGVRRYVALAPLLTLCQCSFLYNLSSFDVEGPASGSDAGNDDAQGPALDAPDDSFALDASAQGMPEEDDVDASPQGALDEGLDAPNTVPPADSDADAGPPQTGQSDAQAASDSTSGLATDAAEAGQSEADAGPMDGAPSSGGSDTGTDASHMVPANDAGLVAYYPFAEATGTTTADGSGNNETATMQGATFSAGIQGNAATMNGMNEYVSLPQNIVLGLTEFSICTWVNLTAPVAQHTHIFDFGTGTNDYVFLTPNSGSGTLQFAITTSGVAAEQKLDATALPAGTWEHICVTLTGTMGALYLNGTSVATNAAMTLNPSSLGPTTQDWLGRSQSASDPYLNGKIDNFRIYNRALSAAEVTQLYQGME